MAHPDEVMTRERLLEAVWGWSFPAGTRRWTPASPSCAACWRRTRATPADHHRARHGVPLLGGGRECVSARGARRLGARPPCRLAAAPRGRRSGRGWCPTNARGRALSALRSDWLLAVGALVSLPRCAALLLRPAGRRGAERRLDEQSAAAARDRRLLLSRLDHELKNPLTAMRAALANVSATAAGRPRGRPAQHRGAGDAAQPADGRPAEGRRRRERRLDRRPVDVAALLEEAMDIAGEQPARGRRSLSVDLRGRRGRSRRSR